MNTQDYHDNRPIDEIYDTWLNGNISDVKREVKKMKKYKFLCFVEYCIMYRKTITEIRQLLN